MPTVTILNEKNSVLHIAMIAGVPLHLTTTSLPEGSSGMKGSPPFTPWGYKARIPQQGNEYSAGDSWSRAGALAGGVAAGSASVVVGSMWALGTFGGWLSRPGRVAVGTAGSLMAAANAGSEAFGRWGDGVVLRKDWWMVWYTDLTYAIRIVDGKYDLAEAKA